MSEVTHITLYLFSNSSSSSSSSFLIISVEGDRDLSASGFELETLFEFINHELFADSTTPPTQLSVTCQLVMRH